MVARKRKSQKNDELRRRILTPRLAIKCTSTSCGSCQFMYEDTEWYKNCAIFRNILKQDGHGSWSRLSACIQAEHGEVEVMLPEERAQEFEKWLEGRIAEKKHDG